METLVDLITLPTAIGVAFAIVIIMVLFDALLGIAKALKEGTFEWNKVAQFAKSNLLPFFIVLGVLAGLGYFINFFYALFYAVGGVIVIQYGGNITQKVKDFFNIT